MRKNFIDNIRSIVILLLFPYHTLRLYTMHRDFYVQGNPFAFADFFCLFNSAWFMCILFILAGMSAYYSLKKRTAIVFFKERISRLLVPFVVGVLFVVPVQSFVADILKNGYAGSYLEHYKVFFTKFTDLTGYDGGFTPGNLWFLLYLFCYSVIIIPLAVFLKKKNFQPTFSIQSKVAKAALLILIAVVFAITGFSTEIKYLYCFIIGYTLFTNENLLSFLKRKANLIFPVSFVGLIISTGMVVYCLYADIPASMLLQFIQNLFGMFFIFGVIGIAQKVLDFSNTYSAWFAKNSFAVYFVHQSILIILAYFVFQITNLVPLQIALCMTITFVLSIITVKLMRRCPLIKNLI